MSDVKTDVCSAKDEWTREKGEPKQEIKNANTAHEESASGSMEGTASDGGPQVNDGIFSDDASTDGEDASGGDRSIHSCQDGATD